MKPMLAHIYSPKRWTGGLCHVQPKLNGVRALYQDGHFQSREELPWNDAVLQHLIPDLKAIFPEPEIILDGELYKHGWPLQRINGAVQIARTEPREDTKEVEYWIFDRVSYQLPFKDRFKLVIDRSELFHGTKICYVWATEVDELQAVEDYYAYTVSHGYEGIMYRLADCPYTRPKQPGGKKFLSDKDNRVWHLLKRKDWQDMEFPWGVMFEGEGKQAGMLGAFGCLTADGTTFKVGSGLTDAERIHYWNNPPNGKKIKVKFLTWTSEGRPFNPTIEAIL